jgi:hypothetical protein
MAVIPMPGTTEKGMENFIARKKERVKKNFPVHLKYRIRDDDKMGYLEITFDEETAARIRQRFHVPEGTPVFLKCKMVDVLLHVENEPTGQIGYKLSKDRTLQVSSLQTANIPEPPDDEAHRAGVTADLMLRWNPNYTHMSINIPRTLFVVEERGGTGKKLRARKE